MNPSTSKKGRAGSHSGLRVVGAVLVLALVVVLVGAIVGCGEHRHRHEREPERRGRHQAGRRPQDRRAAGQRQLRPGPVRRRRLRHPAAAADLREARHAGPGLHASSRRSPPSGTPRTARCGRSRCSDGVKFSNGQDFTADDVVYTMDRLRSKKLGSPMADVYANIKSVVGDRPDDGDVHARQGRLGVPGLAHRLPHADALQDGQGPGQGGRRHRPVRARVHLG